MKNYNKVLEEKKESPAVTEAVKETEPTETQKEYQPKTVVVANCSLLNVRDEPNKHSKIQCVMRKHDILHAISDDNGWLKISSKSGRIGYVMKEYTEEV